MAVRLKLVRVNNLGSEEPSEAFRVVTVKQQTVRFRDIAQSIAAKSSLTEADAMAATYAFMDAVRTNLLLGKSVELESLGWFRIVVNSQQVGADLLATKSVRLKPLLRRVKVAFVPDKRLMDEIRSKIEFREIK